MERKEQGEEMKAKLVRLKQTLLHNLGLKLVSLALAFVIWFIVAQVGDPKDTRAYNNIKVNLINADLLDAQSKVYEVLDHTDIVKVNVTAPTSVFQTLRAGDIVAEADVSKLTDINTIAITYYTVNPNLEIESFEGDHDVVKLSVENKRSKTMRVVCQPVGEVAENYVIGSTTVDQNTIEITGPESSINQIGGAYAELNVEGATTTSTATVEVRLRDKEGNFLNLNNVTMSATRLVMTVDVLATKEIPIEAYASGTPADGYMIAGDPQMSVNKVRIAGVPAALVQTSKIVIPAEKLDITDAKTDVDVEFNLKEYLPQGIRFADNDFNGKVVVSVPVRPSRERTLEIPTSNITFINVPVAFTVEAVRHEEETNTAALRIYGLRDKVNVIRAGSVKGKIDITAWMKENGKDTLTAGIYEIPVEYDLDDGLTVLSAEKVQVKISEKE